MQLTVTSRAKYYKKVSQHFSYFLLATWKVVKKAKRSVKEFIRFQMTQETDIQMYNAHS